MSEGKISKPSFTKSKGKHSSLSSYSSSSIHTSDVFLNFSAEDTSRSFVSHLYRSLSEKGVPTYYKDDDLEKGISYFVSDARKRIIESKVAVVVVSQSYLTSYSCLNELQTILDFHDEGQLSVLPIFFIVDPSDVRKQTGVVAEVFEKLGEEYPDDIVKAWRIALTKLTNISGLDSRFWSKGANMVDLIRNEILLLLSNKPSSPSTTKTDGPVALDRHMLALYELLDLKSDKEVRLVGICGPGGVGKTTLARYAYEELSGNFHAHMFVETFTSRETQEGAKKTMSRSPNVASAAVIKSALRHRKGLLVIDCVDNREQLKEIAEIVCWFGSESRVIFVTQDKNLLDEFGVRHVYEVQSLRYDEALQLFSQSAFKQQHPPTARFESLSLRAVQVSSFLPLTLKILGSFLQDKDERTWEEELQKLEGDKEKTIMEVMKKSYSSRANE